MKKHVVITGGGSGIGAAIAQKLDTGNYAITLMGRDLRRVQEQAETLKQGQGISVDVGEAGSVTAGFETACTQFGMVDILINSAGVATTMPFSKVDRAHWDLMISVNLTGVFNTISTCLPDMKNKAWGRIINISSTAGLIGYEYCAAYCASKHGVIGLTKSLALETARSGVTINAICPGFTETEIVKKGLQNIMKKTGRSHDEAKSSMVDMNPQKRFVQPQEIASTVAWLLLDESAAITGQSISVSGGEVML